MGAQRTWRGIECSTSPFLICNIGGSSWEGLRQSRFGDKRFDQADSALDRRGYERVAESVEQRSLDAEKPEGRFEADGLS